MIPKLPIYAKGDSIGIAVYPTGVSLEEVEIDMLVYTTGTGREFTDRPRQRAADRQRNRSGCVQYPILGNRKTRCGYRNARNDLYCKGVRL